MGMHAEPKKSVFPELQTTYDFRAEIMERADEFEKNRMVSADLIQRLAADKVFAGAMPANYGGTQRSPTEMFKVIESLSYADGSVGWCSMIYLITGVLCGYLPEAGADEVFSDPSVLLCGATAPTGRAKKVDGGYLVNGQWAWGSGSNNSHWICGGALVMEEGDKVPTLESGQIKVQLMVFKAEEVEILDNWHVFGMQGTSSNDFRVKDVFVPDDRSFVLGDTAPCHPADIYKFPFFSLFATGVSAIPLGIAQRAMDEFCGIAESKVPMWRSRTLNKRAVVQATVAEAESLIQSGRSYLLSVLEPSWQKILDGGVITGEERVQHRLAAATATQNAVEAVRLLYTASGGSAVHYSNPMQYCLRNVSIATQHMMVNPSVFEQTGNYLLNGGPYSHML